MRKTGRVLSRLALVVVVLWCGLWYLGRVTISDRLDDGLAALAAEGLEVRVGDHAISGFPFGYTARLTDVSLAEIGTAGPSVSLPHLTGEVHVAAPDEVVARFPESFDLALPAAEGAEPRRVAVASEGLSLTAGGLAGSERVARLSAERIDVTEARAAGRLEAAVTRLAARAAQPEGQGPAGAAEAETLSVTYAMPAPRGGQVTLEARLESARLTGASDMAGPEDIARMLGGLSRGPGRAETVLEGTRLALTVTAEGTGPGSDGRFDLTGGPVEIGLAVTDGNMEARLALDAAAWRLEMPGRALAGTVTTGPVTARYAMPLGPSEALQPVAVELEVAGAEPDGALWQALDPGGALPRGPLALMLDVGGTARLTKPFAAARPGEAPPVVPGTLSLRAARLTGLGAAAQAEGAVEFSGGQAPTGSVTVTFEGAIALLRRLSQAGLIGPAELQTLALGLAGYTVRGSEPGTLETRLSLDRGRLAINGDPVR